MALPKILQKLFANDGVGPLLRSDIMPIKTVDGYEPDAAGNINVTPIASVIAFAANSAPSGYLLCNGAAVSRTTYAKLFAAIGTTYGAGDGSTTFNLPNLTDKFIQGSGTAGTVKAAGLPNISTGGITNMAMLRYSEEDYYKPPFYLSGGSVGTTATGNNHVHSVSFDASRCSSIYGNSTTVQPPALTMRYYIKY